MTAIRAWTTGFLVAVCASCNAGETLPVRIQIVVYDGAALGPQTLSFAENLTGKILLASGLETQWSAGPTSDLQRLGVDFSPHRGRGCPGQLPDVLRVQVLARAPAGLSAQTLGFSLPCAMAGIQVTLYADRVAEVSERTAPTFRRVLGYALAHELGHVLLRSAVHEDSGLMKAVWSTSDWRRAAVSIMPFSPEQSRRIVGAIQDSRSAAMAQRAPIHNY